MVRELLPAEPEVHDQTGNQRSDREGCDHDDKERNLRSIPDQEMEDDRIPVLEEHHNEQYRERRSDDELRLPPEGIFSIFSHCSVDISINMGGCKWLFR